MTETPETPEKRPQVGAVKRYLLIGAGIGAGLALVLSAVVGAWSWWESRPKPPKPWDTKAITCTFGNAHVWTVHDVQGGETGEYSVSFEFVCQNNSDEDVWIHLVQDRQTDPVVVTHAFKDGSIGNQLDAMLSSLSLNKPIFIPAKGKQRVTVNSESLVSKDSPDALTLLNTYPMRHLKSKSPDLVGFTAFLPEQRYQIMFPVPDDARVK